MLINRLCERKKKPGFLEFAYLYHANSPTRADFKVLVIFQPAYRVPENLSIGYFKQVTVCVTHRCNYL